MTKKSETRAVALPNGFVAYFEITDIKSQGGDGDIFEALYFQSVLDSVEGVASALETTMRKLPLKNASVEFGVPLSAKEGKLLAVFVEGERKANFKITLKWGS